MADKKISKTEKQTETKHPIELNEEDLEKAQGAGKSLSWDNTKHVKWESKL